MKKSPVLADYLSLNKVITNILHNAVAVCPNYGTVAIDLELTVENKQRLSVTDSAEQIPVDEHQNLFQAFSTFETDQVPNGMSGFELEIASGLINLMQGRIGIENASKEGNTIWIELPLAASNI